MNRLTQNVEKCKKYINENGLQEKYALVNPMTDFNLMYFNPFDDLYRGFRIAYIDEQSQDRKYMTISEFMKIYNIK